MLATLTVVFLSALSSTIAFPSQGLANATKSDDLITCLHAKSVPFETEVNGDFGALSRAYNLAFHYVPDAIALPSTVSHVRDAVVCADRANVKVQARCGGHSYAAFGLGGTSGSLVVDMGNFHGIDYDENTGIAKVGGGVRLGNLATALYNNWNRAMPHGTCPGVGIGGHAIHGGYGFSSRKWGLTLDNIVAVDVVLASGAVIHASLTANKDIFYAIRGAGDNIGVVTMFYFKTFLAPAETVIFSISVPQVMVSKESAATAFRHIQNAVQSPQITNENLGLGILVERSAFRLNGMYFGSLDSWRNTVKPALLRNLPSPSSDTSSSRSWDNALLSFSGGPLEVPLTGYDQHDTFFAKSILTRESAPLTQQALESFFDYVMTQDSHGSPWFVIIDLYGGSGSLINKVASSATSFSQRDSLWVFQLYGTKGTSMDATVHFIQNMANSVTASQPNGNFGAYLNYVDPSLSAAQAHQLYYGQETYQRLLKIKQAVDPKHTFWNPHSIGN